MTKKNTKHMNKQRKTLKNTGPHNVPLSLSLYIYIYIFTYIHIYIYIYTHNSFYIIHDISHSLNVGGWLWLDLRDLADFWGENGDAEEALCESFWGEVRRGATDGLPMGIWWGYTLEIHSLTMFEWQLIFFSPFLAGSIVCLLEGNMI